MRPRRGCGRSRIGDFHIRHGLFAGAGTIYRLPRIVGLRKARELMLSGDVLDGSQAKAWNLVNETAPLADFEGLVDGSQRGSRTRARRSRG